MQHLALKAAIVLLAVALQTPGQRSKAKEHQECLEKRLTLCRNGEIESLLREGRMIQQRLSKSNKNDAPNKARSTLEGLTKPLTLALTSTVGVSGRDRELHFSI